MIPNHFNSQAILFIILCTQMLRVIAFFEYSSNELSELNYRRHWFFSLPPEVQELVKPYLDPFTKWFMDALAANRAMVQAYA